MTTAVTAQPVLANDVSARRRTPDPVVHDLAIIVVSTNEAKWLTPCLRTVYDRAGDTQLDVVVADNESTDGTRALVEREFPRARVVTCPNRGFSHANNSGLATTRSRYVLFLNPDTEVVSGTFRELVDALDERPTVGLAGVRQVSGEGELQLSVRRFPSVSRAVGDAICAERLPIHLPWMGERECDPARYDREISCDWTSGSFMIARREALESAGWLDERFFIYAEETDLCLRIKRAGWEIRHLPTMTIVHHAGKSGVSPKMESQGAYARLQYARKHFVRERRIPYVAAVGARYAIRALAPSWGDPRRESRKDANRQALLTLIGRREPPFGSPPATALSRGTVGAAKAQPALNRSL